MMLLSGYWPEGSYKSLSQQFERLFCYIYHSNILMVYAPALCFGRFMVAFLFSIHLEERDMAALSEMDPAVFWHRAGQRSISYKA